MLFLFIYISHKKMSGPPFCFWRVLLDLDAYCRSRGYPVEIIFNGSGNHIIREISVDCNGVPISLPPNWEKDMSDTPTNPEKYKDPEETDPAQIVEAAGYNPLAHLWPCPSCTTTPCLWKANEEAIRALKNRISLDYPDYENNEVRKMLYRQATFVVYGFLGKNQRRQLPSCIVEGIRSLCPSPTYMGFMSR